MDAALIKRFGEGAFIQGNDFIEYKRETVHVSPCLDIVLGGGIVGGSYVCLIGPPKVGKTLTALHISGNAQKLGRKIFYFNIEGRIKSRDINGIKHLNPSEMTIIRSYRDDEGNAKIMTAEDYLTVASHIVHNVPGSVLIFDSVSALAASKTLEAEIGTQQRAPGAVLMAQFLGQHSNVVPVNDNIIIAIQHLVANTSGFGASTTATGGTKIKYAADVLLTAKGFKLIRAGGVTKEGDDESTEPAIGQEVTWLTGATSFIAPGQKITSIIRYGVGIDEIAELIKLGKDTGFIDGSTWLSLNYLKDVVDPIPKVQGREKLYNYFLEHEDHLELLKGKIQEMFQLS